jgi:hypothetical protein
MPVRRFTTHFSTISTLTTMDQTLYSIPTPKTLTKPKQLNRDDRLRVQTLYFDANWTIDDIVLQTNYTKDQVRYAINHRITPQKQRCGTRPYLNTPQRKRLIEWVSASDTNRRVPWSEIPSILGWECGEKAIRTAFKKEGYVRRSALQKPPLTEEHKKQRLEWAWEHLFWLDEEWDRILWTDDTWVRPGRHRRPRITRKIGRSELYNPTCIEPRYQRKIGWMF